MNILTQPAACRTLLLLSVLGHKCFPVVQLAGSRCVTCYKALRSRLTSQVRRSPISLRYSQEQRPFPPLKASCSLGGAFLFDLRGDFSSNQFCIGLSGIFSSTGLPNESHETILQYILRQLQQDLLR